MTSLKLKLYLFSSPDAEQRQDQRHLPFKEKKDGIYPGPLTYASGLMIGRNFYGGKINPAEFYKRLEQSKQFLKRKCDK